MDSITGISQNFAWTISFMICRNLKNTYFKGYCCYKTVLCYKVVLDV